VRIIFEPDSSWEAININRNTQVSIINGKMARGMAQGARPYKKTT